MGSLLRAQNHTRSTPPRAAPRIPDASALRPSWDFCARWINEIRELHELEVQGAAFEAERSSGDGVRRTSSGYDADGANRLVWRFVHGTRSNVPEYGVRYDPCTGAVLGTYRFITDIRGSVRLVVRADGGAGVIGTIAQRIDYDPWGRVLLDSNPGFQPFGFAGGLWDAETELVRFGARDCDPEVGRWTAKPTSTPRSALRFGRCIATSPAR